MNKDLVNGVFKHSPYIPANLSLTAPLYSANYNHAYFAGVTPYAYTGWRDEQMSWYETCYIHGGLNPTDTYYFKGKDALKFCDRYFTNSFKNFPIGKSKHGIMVNEDGLLMSDGLLLRIGEDEFLTFWLNPYLSYAIEQSGYDIQGKNVSGDVYMYQLGGPKSLEIVEAACGEDLHDIPFAGHRTAKIAGKDVMILRIGMAGALAYEVHGRFEDREVVYNALLEAGNPYGIRKLGRQAYWNTHTENGFPQYTIHFFYAWETAPGMVCNTRAGSTTRQTGSYDPDYRHRYVNPYELGWGFCVNLNHDFLGRDALKKIKESKHREMRTLVWNPDDVVDVYRSQFDKGEPYFTMEGPEDAPKLDEVWDYRMDQILDGDKCVGVSSGRCFSWYYRDMISLAIIDPEYAELGTEIEVLWGNPGTRQKRIRATVSRFPYYNEPYRNEKFDVEQIPHPDFGKIKASAVAGDYAVTVKTPMGDQDGSFSFDVSDSALSGTATAMGSTAEIWNGTVKDNTFALAMELKTPMGKMKLKVTGEVSGDTITGTMKTGPMSMSFSGKRKA